MFRFGIISVVYKFPCSAESNGLMEAIANAGGGVCIIVPGNASIEAMQAELLAAFGQIAANVPPPKLLHEAEE